MLGVSRLSDEKARFVLAERERDGLNAPVSSNVEASNKSGLKFAQDNWWHVGSGNLRDANGG